MLLTCIISALFVAATPVVAHVVARADPPTTFTTSKDGAILTVTLDNPVSPVNLFSEVMQFELDKLVTSLQTDDSTKVVIFRSGNPKFFIAHYDVIPRPGDPLPISSPELAPFNARLLFNITSLPQATIGVVEGPARGMGNEFVMSFDMRFASPEAVFSNFEVTLGLHPGAGGVVYMSELIGRGRTLEYILSGNDIDANTAEQFGLVNKVLPSPAELDAYVAKLSSRIALFPLDGISSIKTSVNDVTRAPLDQYLVESSEWNRLLALKLQQDLIAKFLVLSKNETDVDVEFNLGEDVVEVYN